jgi:hypothetical protein
MKEKGLPADEKDLRIRELERQLFRETMRAECLGKMIGIAERELKIDIGKKSGVKQSTINRISLNLIKNEQSKKRSVKGKRLDAGWNNDYLLKILTN